MIFFEREFLGATSVERDEIVSFCFSEENPFSLSIYETLALEMDCKYVSLDILSFEIIDIVLIIINFYSFATKKTMFHAQ